MWISPGRDKLCPAERQGKHQSRGVVVYRRGFFLQKDFRAFTPGRRIESTGAPMRITTTTANENFYLRAARHVVLCGVFALAACQDVTAPEQVEAVPQALRMSQSAAADEIASLASNLDDFTGWSLAALPNAQGKANIVGILNGLKGHLSSGKIAACQQDVTDARAILGSLTEVQQVEVGSIGVALDVIQAALDKASQ
jgi:hypothetical protein